MEGVGVQQIKGGGSQVIFQPPYILYKYIHYHRDHHQEQLWMFPGGDVRKQ